MREGEVAWESLEPEAVVQLEAWRKLSCERHPAALPKGILLRLAQLRRSADSAQTQRIPCVPGDGTRVTP